MQMRNGYDGRRKGFCKILVKQSAYFRTTSSNPELVQSNKSEKERYQ